MRVLDLDLDFFMDTPTTGKGLLDGRARDDEHTPWIERNVVAFLENQCGLSRGRRIPGRFVTDHHEAFLTWREWIDSKRLTVPFSVDHVDAHADVGYGMDGWEYLLNDIVHRDVADRLHPQVDDESMHIGNYLLFAAACRWLSQLTYVSLDEGRDLLYLAFKDFDVRSGALQLMKYNEREWKTIMDRFAGSKPKELIRAIPPLALEPEVPFRVVPHREYKNTEPFDLMILCHSPRYTTPRSDTLIPVIREYFEDA